MHYKSSKKPLLILGLGAIVFSRILFIFFDDPEGTNLLVTTVMALIVYFLSLPVYVLNRSSSSFKKLLLAILVQIVIVTGLFFWLN
jgi:O-antigen/teichoic acid export membrane protein